MKGLKEYIKENYDKDLEITSGINHDHFGNIYLYLVRSNDLNDRFDSIVSTYRDNYNDSLSASSLKTSKIFNIFIDDLISLYNKEYPEVELNISTKNHLINEIASLMITKIRTEFKELDKSKVEDD